MSKQCKFASQSDGPAHKYVVLVVRFLARPVGGSDACPSKVLYNAYNADFEMLITVTFIQRVELLKQQYHKGKVVSNIHRLAPKNTQKMQMN